MLCFFFKYDFQINKMCADRGVFFNYVDLRWGITSEQTDDGKTISICLQEVYCIKIPVHLASDQYLMTRKKQP